MRDKSVKEIKEIADNLSEDKYLEFIEELKGDEDKNLLNKIAISLAKEIRQDKIRRERLERINATKMKGMKRIYLYS